MAYHHGNEGTVKIGSASVAEVQDWSYNDEDIDVQEVSSMGDTAVVPKASGIKRGGGTVNCLWDETDTNGQEAMTPGAEVTLNLYPEGAATGDAYYSGTVVISRNNYSGGKTGMVMRGFDFVGPLTKGTV
jgi:hypothetical protein